MLNGAFASEASALVFWLCLVVFWLFVVFCLVVFVVLVVLVVLGVWGGGVLVGLGCLGVWRWVDGGFQVVSGEGVTRIHFCIFWVS